MPACSCRVPSRITNLRLAFASSRRSHTLASTAYAPAAPQNDANASTPPDLTPKQRQIIEHIVRVDQAGELGANWIYKGQYDVLKAQKKGELAALIKHMWDAEKKHIDTFDKVVVQHRVRPTALYPVWKAAGWLLGAGTALMGRESAMACTEAVETVIGEHYNDQLKQLETHFDASHPSIKLLKDILIEFRDDELEHLDTAIENDSQKAPAHALLSSAIGAGCHAAIEISKKI